MLTTRTNTFLRSSCSVVWALIKAQENIFELIHTRVGEQQGWIIPGHDRTGRDHLMAFGFKEL
jgi:hypothetical protein